MRAPSAPPLIGVSACLKPRDHHLVHSVVEKYVDAIIDGSGGVPIIIPALASRLDIDTLLDRIDGIFLTGSPSNVDPKHYGGPKPREGNIEDPVRDGTVLPLIRKAVARGVPVFAVCRGIQELNVAYGGTLHQQAWEVPGRADHRSDKTKHPHDRYELRHKIALTPGGVLSEILGGKESIEVNSLHGQAVDRVGQGLRVEAVADDGTIEGLSVEDARGFALGLQWHPEWKVRDDPNSLRIFQAFGAACANKKADVR